MTNAPLHDAGDRDAAWADDDGGDPHDAGGLRDAPWADDDGDGPDDAGVISAASGIFHEGARFPSAHLAPVRTPYLIFGYGFGWSTPASIASIPQVTIVDRGGLTSGATLDWATASVLPLERTSAAHYASEETLYEQYLVPAQARFYGMSVDEYGWETTAILNSFDAMRRIKTAYPEFWIQAWFFSPNWSALTALKTGEDVVNLYVPEAYVDRTTDYSSTKLEVMIQRLMSFELEDRAVIGLSAGRWSSRLDEPSDVDRELHYVRSRSPQLASNGVAFFKLTTTYAREHLSEYAAVLEAHFYAPSPEAEILAPRHDATVSGVVEVRANGTPNSTTGSPIVAYRFFIDNVLERVSSSPSFRWNTSGYASGPHVLTVHAVAEDYRAGVGQVSVVLP